MSPLLIVFLAICVITLGEPVSLCKNVTAGDEFAFPRDLGYHNTRHEAWSVKGDVIASQQGEEIAFGMDVRVYRTDVLGLCVSPQTSRWSLDVSLWNPIRNSRYTSSVVADVHRVIVNQGYYNAWALKLGSANVSLSLYQGFDANHFVLDVRGTSQDSAQWHLFIMEMVSNAPPLSGYIETSGAYVQHQALKANIGSLTIRDVGVGDDNDLQCIDHLSSPSLFSCLLQYMPPRLSADSPHRLTLADTH